MRLKDRKSSREDAGKPKTLPAKRYVKLHVCVISTTRSAVRILPWVS